MYRKLLESNISTIFDRMPWQKLHNGIAATEDEEVFNSLAHAFADKYPEIYQPDACLTSPNHGIFHGADLHTQNYSVMDDMYTKSHSYMVIQENTLKS